MTTATAPRRLGFRLRTLMLAVLVFGVVFGYVVVRVGSVRTELDLIRRANGVAVFDYQQRDGVFQPAARSWVPDPVRGIVGDEFFHDVAAVNVFGDANEVVAVLEAAGRLPNVRFIYVSLSTPSAPPAAPNVPAGAPDGLDLPPPAADVEAVDDPSSPATVPSLPPGFPVGQGAPLPAAAVEAVARIRSLQGIRFLQFPVGETEIARLSSLPDLRRLELMYCGVTDRGLAEIARMTRLRALDLTTCAVTDAGLSNLEGLTELEELSLQGNNVTDAGMTHLRGLTRLRTLDLSFTKVTDLGLVPVEGLHDLRELCLGRDSSSDAGLSHLAGLSRLEVLCAEMVPFLESNPLEAKMTKKGLLVDRHQVTDRGLTYLRGLTGLRRLSLYGAITDEGLSSLSGLTKLERLELRGSDVTDAGLARLAGLKALKDLDLFQQPPGVTDEGVDALARSLPNLKRAALQAPLPPAEFDSLPPMFAPPPSPGIRTYPRPPQGK